MQWFTGKKNIRKRIRVLAVSALMLVGAVPLTAGAQETGLREMKAREAAPQESGTDEAPDIPEETASLRDETLPDGGSASAEFTGTVQASILSVELPCRIGFRVEPGKEGEEDTITGQVSSQFTGPTEAMVINNSIVPVKVEIIKVDPVESEIRNHPVTGAPQEIRLVGTLAEVSEPGTAIMALRSAGETFETAEAFEQYAILPGGPETLEADGGAAGNLPVLVAEIEPGEETALQIYGRLLSGSSFGNFSFQVTPYLKVSPL